MSDLMNLRGDPKVTTLGQSRAVNSIQPDLSGRKRISGDANGATKLTTIAPLTLSRRYKTADVALARAMNVPR
jgi:hypothetical protein